MTDQQRPKPYDVEVTVAAGRDLTWGAVTQSSMLRQWFGWDYDGLDAEIRQIFVDQAAFLAPKQMGWADGSYLEVSGDEASATVRVVREGPRSGDPDRYDAIEEGWRSFLIQLRFLLEEKPQGARRTLYLTGTTTGREALALAGGKTAQTGTTAARDALGPAGGKARQTATTTGRDPVGAAGGKATQAGNRVAWLVDTDGHLVVIAGREHLDSREPGRMEVIVSTYGLDDAAFDVVRKRWAERWVRVARGAKVTTADTPAP